MRLVFIGATGETGRWTLCRAVDSGDSVTVLARRPEALADAARHVGVIEGDATSAGDLGSQGGRSFRSGALFSSAAAAVARRPGRRRPLPPARQRRSDMDRPGRSPVISNLKATHMTTPRSFSLGGDLPVNRIGFGAMRLASDGMGAPARDPEAAMAVLRRAVALGVNHIDTAAFYVSADRSVRANALIREALSPFRDELVIATKVGPVLTPGGGMRLHSEPRELRAAVETNLVELGLNRLDVVYLRTGGGMAPDPTLSVTEQYEALAEMQAEGLIRHLALSNVTARQVTEARRVAPVVAVQNNFHAANRDDAELILECERAGIAFVPFFPLGGGFADLGHRRVAEVAGRHGATVPQIALAWLLAFSPTILAIPGTGSVDHLAENVAAGSISLTADELALLA